MREDGGVGSGLHQHWGPALQSLPDCRMGKLIIRTLKSYLGK